MAFAKRHGGFALKPDAAGAFVAPRNGLFGLDFAGGKFAKLFDAPFDSRTHRFNEADCDRWAPLDRHDVDPNPNARSAPTKGNLYSFTASGGLIEPDTAVCSTTASPGPRTARNSSRALARGSNLRVRIRCGKRPAWPRRVFAEIPNELGIPDGGAFDEHGVLLERHPSRRSPAPLCAGRTTGCRRRATGPEPDHDGLLRA